MVLRPPMQLGQTPVSPWLLKRQRRARRAMWLLSGSIVFLAISLTVGLVGCQPSIHQSPWPESIRKIHPPLALPATRLKGEPRVRVRIVQRANEVHLDASQPLIIGPTPSQQALATARLIQPPVTLSHDGAGFVIRPKTGQALRWALRSLQIQSDGPIRVGANRYPPLLQIHRSKPTPTHPAAHQIDVVNHVNLENYLPGVLSRELFAHWHLQTYMAQAIAARSYAIVQHFSHQNQTYDLESTTASQAYGGISRSPRALEAVRLTRGVVLAYQNRVLPAYYASCCGGTSQDAAIAFPHGAKLPPLTGRQRAAWCRASKWYRWGPIRRERDALTRRLVAWGRQMKHPIAHLQTLTAIKITQVNQVGRPARFQITDRAGNCFELMPESFRFACNHDAPGLGALKKAAKLHSSHVQVMVQGNEVLFTDGRGFGHGVGLCQYGAQAMAQSGIDAARILGYYYPGAKRIRVYK